MTFLDWISPDPLVQTSLIVAIPAIIVLVWFGVSGRNIRGGGRQDLYILLGILTITLFYIYAPDPSVVYSLFASKGDIVTPSLFAIVAGVFLVLSVFYFGTARRSGGSSS